MICPECKEEREERHLHVDDDQCEFCMMDDAGYDDGKNDICPTCKEIYKDCSCGHEGDEN